VSSGGDGDDAEGEYSFKTALEASWCGVAEFSNIHSHSKFENVGDGRRSDRLHVVTPIYKELILKYSKTSTY
jgi:hypothetical protein